METIKLMLADDHLIIRDGIKSMLLRFPEIEVVKEVSSGDKVIEYLEKNPNRVDVVLMDVNMPGMDGVETTREISKKYKNVKVLTLTMHAEDIYISNMIEAGALGYLLKDSTVDELIEAVKTVASGKQYFTEEVASIINILNVNCDSKK